MDAFSSVRSGEEPYMQLDRMQLRTYYPYEIEKLSVMRVTQTKTFDELSHAILGGLYDPLLGPTGDHDKCQTCDQYQLYCPGHFGHIRLEVPAFNPFLFQFTYNLMKGSCVHCHRLTCGADQPPARLVRAQLRCFELGVPDVAEDIQTSVKDAVEAAEAAGTSLTTTEHLLLLAEIDGIIRKRAEERASTLGKEELPPPVKTGVHLRKFIVNRFLKEHLFRLRVKCPLCKKSNGTLRNDGARSLLIDFTTSKSEKTARKLKKLKDGLAYESHREDMEESEEDEEDDGKNWLDDDDKVGVADPSENSVSALDKQMASVEKGQCTKLSWRGAEVREHFRMLWQQDGHLLEKLFPMLDSKEANEFCPLDTLFCELVLVPPVKFRPIRFFKGERYEHPQTVNLRKLLEASELIKAINLVVKGSKDSALHELISNRVQGKTMNARMHNAYLNLQLRMNCLFDENLNKADPAHIPGIKQILEKKQGLFRMNMMGKRVNFACRSVITPDPYLDIDEIGIPLIFAKKLTFTEPVNTFNLSRMKELILAGSEEYPGANFMIKPNGHKILLAASKVAERTAVAYRLCPPEQNSLQQPSKVLRHLQKGDMMIMNRQPSLHKPSIMGHRARILTGQRALRMNYAPCKAYNADFDGDEMNGHLVQTHIAQAEVSEIASVGENFLVPKDATPLLGLIQDHVVSGVLLTLRGRFLEKEDFMHLVLASFAEYSERIDIPIPAMIKPQMLWSGKQVISTIIRNCIPKDKPKINLTGKAKTPLSCWKVPGYPTPKFNMSESEVVFRQGELLVGVLDKAHYGATQYGLGHCIFELYGQRVGVKVLSCFSRLFTTFLQLHGFTLGVADILVRKEADEERKKAVKESRTIGDDVVRNAFNLDKSATREEMTRVLAATYCNPRGPGQDIKMLDFTLKQAVAKYNDAIVQACVPDGLIRSFPENGLQMMIQSGAKGSSVNAIQISCNLGQIELEGKRMAVTIAGRTLPSFKAFDTSPRAGGYIDQRFLTGINPQELFFHTMAGREGLIDTAVKTSRSGYLQRCIIKHLEGLMVQYDHTVRDHDGSIVQFRYGEDGMDTCKATFMEGKKNLPFLADNIEAATKCSKPPGVKDRDFDVDYAEHQFEKVKAWRNPDNSTVKRRFRTGFTVFSEEREGDDKARIVQMWREMTHKKRKSYMKLAGTDGPTPVDQKYNPATTLGALPEKMLEGVDQFLDVNKERVKKALYWKALSKIKPGRPVPDEMLEKNNQDAEGKMEELKRTLYWKGRKSMAEPGENVGLLAAQSIGEPSTQMTLNTFHFAGRGEMNVTLGIPRLREILMTASKNIATPSAQIAVLPGTPRETVEKIKCELDRVYLKQVLSRFSLEEHLNVVGDESVRLYTLRLELLRAEKREINARHVKRYKILREIERHFVRAVAISIDKRRTEVRNQTQIAHRKLRAGNIAAGVVDREEDGPEWRPPPADDVSSDEEAEGGKEADAGEQRLHARHRDDAAEYEGEDDERGATDKQDDSEKEDSEKEDEGETKKEETMEDGEGEAGGEGGEGERTGGATGATDKAASPPGPPTRPRLVERLTLTERIHSVIKQSDVIVDYKMGANDRWCEATLRLPLRDPKLDVASIIEKEVDRFIVSQTPKIERCIEREDTVDGKTVTFLQTQGINLEAFYKHADVLDVNTLSINDLNVVLTTYGVEACSRAIVTEMTNVFSVYGIEVSKRHLSLTADYMTFMGQISPFNRGAMAISASPLQKMTFETTIAFMREALITGEDDTLQSPSSRLVVGSLNRGGTGAFDLLNDPTRTIEGY